MAKKRQKESLPFVVYRHETPLLRQLSQVDMWIQRNKIINLRLASRCLDGVIIEPQQIFSYWRLIGKPTRRKGYVEGMILSHGQVKTGIGGGLCQLSNLIYWLTLHTPLTVKERYRHSYDVFPDTNRQQPFGSGATCFYNYLDLLIGNESQQRFQLRLYLNETHLVGEWRTDVEPMYAYQVYEQKHWITREYWGGCVRHNRIHRSRFSRDGEWLDDEYVTENHAIMMYEPFLPERADTDRTS